MQPNRTVVLLATLALTAPCLAAQGGPQARRASARTETPAAVSFLEPARTLLHHLVGRWHFEVRFAGNFDGPADASGTRVVDTLFEDLRLKWTDTHDDSDLYGEGVIGFDTQTGRLYSSAVLSAGTGMEFLLGTVSRVEPVITFAPIAADSGTSYTWMMVDADHFVWAPLDRGWRAVFTRLP